MPSLLQGSHLDLRFRDAHIAPLGSQLRPPERTGRVHAFESIENLELVSL
jgi:hypothetical protein